MVVFNIMRANYIIQDSLLISCAYLHSSKLNIYFAGLLKWIIVPLGILKMATLLGFIVHAQLLLFILSEF